MVKGSPGSQWGNGDTSRRVATRWFVAIIGPVGPRGGFDNLARLENAIVRPLRGLNGSDRAPRWIRSSGHIKCSASNVALIYEP